MEVIEVDIKKDESYSVLIENGLLLKIGRLLDNLLPKTQIAIITNKKVKDLYASKVTEGFDREKRKYQFLEVPDGERYKSLKIANLLFSRMVEQKIDRRTILLALGGGVINDLVGFIAATYMRGISYVNVPTTLVAQHDASIGGKVAVNHILGKNLIGSFYQPKAVYIDPSVLATLPKREIRNGLSEAIKVAIIHSLSLFEFIEKNYQALLNRENSALYQLISEAAKIKVKLISSDPFEENLHRPLNFGHTIGHAVETKATYRGIKHGEAVSIGMAVATRIARQRGICSQETAERIINLLMKIGLPVSINRVDSQKIWNFIKVIKMVRGGNIHFVLPVKIGEVLILDDVTEDDIGKSLEDSIAR